MPEQKDFRFEVGVSRIYKVIPATLFVSAFLLMLIGPFYWQAKLVSPLFTAVLGAYYWRQLQACQSFSQIRFTNGDFPSIMTTATTTATASVPTFQTFRSMLLDWGFEDTTTNDKESGSRGGGSSSSFFHPCFQKDCHAEIVARRSLLRWLYSEIEKADSGDSVVMERGSAGTPFVFEELDLWLYVSRAPCGDGAIFSFHDTTKSNSKHGKLRVKIEAGTGTRLPPTQEQTFDGNTRSCSTIVALRCTRGFKKHNF